MRFKRPMLLSYSACLSGLLPACTVRMWHNMLPFFCGMHLSSNGAACTGMSAAAPGAGSAMTEMLRRAPDSNAPLAQECFKLLAALLRSCASYKVGGGWPNTHCKGSRPHRKFAGPVSAMQVANTLCVAAAQAVHDWHRLLCSAAGVLLFGTPATCLRWRLLRGTCTWYRVALRGAPVPQAATQPPQEHRPGPCAHAQLFC